MNTTKAAINQVAALGRQFVEGPELLWTPLAAALVELAHQAPALCVNGATSDSASTDLQGPCICRSAVEDSDRSAVEDPDVERWSSYVGRGAIRFYLPLNPQLPNEFFSQLVIVAKDIEARDRLNARLDQMLTRDFPNVIGRVYPLELGPPVGWPVQYRVQGPDIGEVRTIAMKLAAVLAGNPDTNR
eukprot:gene41832-55490_t